MDHIVVIACADNGNVDVIALTLSNDCFAVVESNWHFPHQCSRAVDTDGCFSNSVAVL